jgi:hypothetical protein
VIALAAKGISVMPEEATIANSSAKQVAVVLPTSNFSVGEY